jgi:hypothetical protein
MVARTGPDPRGAQGDPTVTQEDLVRGTRGKPSSQQHSRVTANLKKTLPFLARILRELGRTLGRPRGTLPVGGPRGPGTLGGPC